MSSRDRRHFEIIKSTLEMPDEYIHSIIEYMDRKDLNPDWFAMSDSDIAMHMISVVAKFQDSIELKLLLLSFPQEANGANPFEKKWMKEC